MTRAPLLPPDDLMFVGGDASNFTYIGEAFVRDFVDRGGLRRQDHVLDVGCGVGRIAIPLTAYLDAAGRYEGFDIVAKGIAWCRENITARFSNFRFTHADIANSQYNPQGVSRASDYRFPYPDASFDFVGVTSVFTHMLPDDMAHYVAEMARVMRTGARAHLTWFIVNEASRAALAAGRSTIAFQPGPAGCQIMSPKVPEAAVAYAEQAVEDVLGRHGLRLKEPMRFGVWSGRESDYLGYQDVVLAVKE
jgi:ubiquinone/menaquinone biosynthesis C-methylase UbiE